MKKLLTFIALFCFFELAAAMVVRGPDGRWYGNICVTQYGWQEVPWQLVGSTCFAPMFRQYGFIANT